MAKYRKKPVAIEAVQWTGHNVAEMCKFTNKDVSHLISNGQLYIETLEGFMRANIGDYIIKGVRGEFYPCKPDIFCETYDKVSEEQPTIDPVKHGYVPIGVVKQIQWERDIAMSYLDEAGIGFGEKAELQRKPEWISAKDRLPEKGKSVLVYWDDGFDIGEYVGGEVGDDVYWMPMPEPPERDDE